MKETRRNSEWRQKNGGLSRPEPKWRRYQRKVLYRDEFREVVLCVWPPESASEFHDHGKSSGMVIVLKGIITNVVYFKDGRLHKRESFGPGNTFQETPDMIHQMVNINDESTVETLHIYDHPPLRMKKYKEKDIR